ncbi:MAG: VCBS repeat-containing protein [Myxococcales bacterium]|nr:VCBS repeat-containing protein [Myxococcales bacterium]
MHVDRAWQITLGEPSVVIAVLDSGIRWNTDDLITRVALSRGELPLPEEACGSGLPGDPHDITGDGALTILDYTTWRQDTPPLPETACDSRVTDANGNGKLDPQDLLIAFSNDLDEDGNGWVDDIAGWDTYNNDNDANDETDYGHGTGQAKDAVSATNNGIGDAGVCPRCLFVPVRVADSFIGDSNDFALGVIYAVDTGASLILEALGTLNGTRFMHEAIEYAWLHHVAVVASAADENSFHQNLPGSVNHTIYVHATTYNTDRREDATTFMAFNNCTNYGANLLLSTPGQSCSSEAAGKTAGVVAMVLSAAAGQPLLDPMPASRHLHPDEIKQLLITNVDDISFATSANDPLMYPSGAGWEQRFGYGRTNLYSAVAAVQAGRIPPVVDVTSPTWFYVADPDREPSVDIEGVIDFRPTLYTSFDYVIEWAPGIEPLESQWQLITSGTDVATPLEGVLATLPIAALTIDNPTQPEPDRDVNKFLVTVRVRVNMHSLAPERDGVVGETRRAFNIRRDPDVGEGFPRKLEGSGEASPKFYDLDGDGAMELITADSAGVVYAIGHDGVAPGFPVALRPIDALDAASQIRQSAAFASETITADDMRTAVSRGPAIGDLDGSGPTIVVATYDGYIYAIDRNGAVREGFPIELDRSRATATKDRVVDSGVYAAPVLADVDGDKQLDIIIAAMDGSVYVFDAGGTALPGFPVELAESGVAARIMQTPVVGDIDGDGALDLVLGTNEFDGSGRIYALNHQGVIKPGFPYKMLAQDVLPVLGVGMPNSLALGDIDGDDIVDIAVSTLGAVPQFINGQANVIGFVNNAPYGDLSDATDEPFITAISDASMGDLNNDGYLDLLWGGAGFKFLEFSSIPEGQRVNLEHLYSAWDSKTGSYLPGWPRRIEDYQFFMNAAVADLDDDDLPEAIAGSGGYYVHAWNKDGEQPEGWPKFTGGWVAAAPAVGDFDGDGSLELAIATRNGYLWLWHTRGRIDGRIDWASGRHDAQNTGNMTTPLGMGIGANELGDDGCCSGAPFSPAQGLAPLLVLWTVMRGRRDRRWARTK